MPVNISNIRFGFACNSSSTHSIIVFPDKVTFTDEDVPEFNEYGWQDFVLASKEAKLGYIGTLLHHAVWQNKVPLYIWDYYVQSWLDSVKVENGCYIDHQSRLPLPKYLGSDYVNKEFFDELKAHLLGDNVAIFGGNDNSEGGFRVTDLGSDGQESNVSELMDVGWETARKDPIYGYWLLFNRKSGTKCRFTFGDQDMRYSSLPELVDIKITDYCTKGCRYCYQNSSVDGEHADYRRISTVLAALADLQVPEVALGGGEATLHPNFHDILREAKLLGIVPNFTTRNYDWFKDDKNVAVFNECCGRVAFSVDHSSDIHKVKTLCDYHEFDYWRYCLQIVDKVCDVSYLVKEARGLPITLLGFKECGRAGSYRFSEYDKTRWKENTFDKIAKIRSYDIGVDTKYLEDHRDEIERAGISKLLYTEKEGQYSMYIDAVNGTMAESSYCGEVTPIKATRNYDNEMSDEIAAWFKETSKTVADR